MQRVDRIIDDETFRRLLEHTAELEKDRIFCRHGIDHLLDVARIALIMSYDDGIPIERDVIYAAALLHDIGRCAQYENGTAHEEESARIAPQILNKCGYSDEETDEIVRAIREHGNENIKDEKSLTGILYRADKASRKCYMCKAGDKCHKKPGKRVMSVKY